MTENKKKLKIDAAFVDATKTSEESISAYRSVQIHCALLLETAKSKQLLSRFAAEIHAGMVLEVPEGCILTVFNGEKTLSAADSVTVPSVLLVNGSLFVEQGGVEAIDSFEKIVVNGNVLMPNKLEHLENRIQINGSCSTYPSDSILIQKMLLVDPFFILRAKQDALYYVLKDVAMVDDDLNLPMLIEKKVRIQAKKAVILQKYMQDAAEILHEGVATLIVPDHCVYTTVDGGLDKLMLCHGKRLFINHDLDLEEKDRRSLEAVDYLEVHGCVHLPESLEDLFYQKCKKFDEIEVVRPQVGATINDIPEAEITRLLLELNPKGVHIVDCARVIFQPDIPVELVQKRVLSVTDCAVVACSEEHRGALLTVCEDIGMIMDIEQEKVPEDTDVLRINCASYML